MKALFEYFDYQEYLRDYYEYKKRENPYMSYRYLGRRLQLDPGFLLKVIQGKHHLALRSISPLCSYLKFSEQETIYFQALVQYNKAKSNSDIKMYFEKLLSLRQVHAKPLAQSQYAFYQKWYHSAIHALLLIYEFRGKFSKLAALLDPPISAKEARDSIQLLQDLELVQRDKDGVYRSVEKFVTSGDKWFSAAISEFQKETIKLSADALERHGRKSRDISSLTVAMSADDLDEIRERIRQLRQSILTLENEKEANTVYQINVQVIPVTKTLKDN